MSRYLYKKIQNISPESLNFHHCGLKLTTLGSDPNVLSPCNARRSDPEDSPPANNIPASFSSCTPPAFPSIFL